MNNPLQSAHLSASADGQTAVMLVDDQEALEHVVEAESHVHLPNPSFWPILLGGFIFVGLFGLVFVNTFPLIAALSVPCIVFAMMGWALEDPMAPRKEVAARALTTPLHMITTYEEAAAVGRPTALAEAVLQEAEAVTERTVTVSSTEWSAHPVKVEIEREGVVLALYGKVELEAQREGLEAELLKLPGVIDVKNFLIAEDAISNAVNASIERLTAAGKLEGAKDISVLVENYIINLYGEVPTDEMKYRLERELVGIPGVRVVVNHINLADIPGDLGKTRNR